jgi:protein phosphatase
MLEAKACGLSDVGMIRTHNEDCFEIDSERQLFVVADGMGGHSHGEIASRIAVESIRDFVDRALSQDNTWPFAYEASYQRHSNALKSAIRLAHDSVLGAIQRDGALHGMGTTVAGFLLDRGTAAVAHVGDSRVYRLRGDRLDRLTQDHTWVNEQVIAGFLSEEQARSHPLKNVVTRALGGEAEVEVDLREIDVEAGDLYLLCSDGLTTMLSDEEIQQMAIERRSLDELCRRLVRRANARGGLDNITVLTVQIR